MLFSAWKVPLLDLLVADSFLSQLQNLHPQRATPVSPLLFSFKLHFPVYFPLSSNPKLKL